MTKTTDCVVQRDGARSGDAVDGNASDGDDEAFIDYVSTEEA